MAQEAPNTLHAAIVAAIVAPAIVPSLQNSRGVEAATFTVVGTGRYRVQLTDPIDPFSCCVTGSAVGPAPANHPRIFAGIIVPTGGPPPTTYFLDILTDDDTGTAAEATYLQAQVVKFATDD